MNLSLEETKNIRIKGNEKQLIYNNSGSFYLGGIILLGYFMIFLGFSLMDSQGFMRAVLFTFVAIVGLIFLTIVSIPLLGAFLRGRTILTVTDDVVKNHKISLPVTSIKSAKVQKHPNPFRLWIFNYLVLTDTDNKKHYFNLYNLISPPSALQMMDRFVFKKIK